MATNTIKRTARILTEVIDISITDARHRVSEAVNELRIDRVRYNETSRSWEISLADSKMLVDTLAEAHLVEIGELAPEPTEYAEV